MDAVEPVGRHNRDNTELSQLFSTQICPEFLATPELIPLDGGGAIGQTGHLTKMGC